MSVGIIMMAWVIFNDELKSSDDPDKRSVMI